MSEKAPKAPAGMQCCMKPIQDGDPERWSYECCEQKGEEAEPVGITFDTWWDKQEFGAITGKEIACEAWHAARRLASHSALSKARSAGSHEDEPVARSKLREYDLTWDRNQYPKGPTAEGRKIFNLTGWEGAHRGSLLLSDDEAEAIRSVFYASPTSGGLESRDLLKLLSDLENACERLAATRPQAAYDAMVEGGQADDLLVLDRARIAARNALSSYCHAAYGPHINLWNIEQ